MMMNRCRPFLLAGLAGLALAGCAASPTETAYLDQVRESSTLVDIDEAAELDAGRTVCDTVGDFKPEERERVMLVMLTRQGVPRETFNAAIAHLCPEFTDDVRLRVGR